MDPFKTTQEMKEHLESMEKGWSADTIAMVRAYPLLLEKMDRIAEALEGVADIPDSFREIEKVVPDISQVERTNELLAEILAELRGGDDDG